MNSSQVNVASEILIAGEAAGTALVLEDALSFWGGFDPVQGKIIDQHHPQQGECVAGRVVFIPRSKGSAGTPGGIAENLRNGNGPLAFVLGERDVNISVGVLVANRLYGMDIPVLRMPEEQMLSFASGDPVRVDRDGRISILAEG